MAHTQIEKIKKEFETQGYVVVPDVVTAAQLEELRRMVDDVLRGAVRPEIDEPGAGSPLPDFDIQWEPEVRDDPLVAREEKVRVAFHLCHVHPYFRAHALRPEITDIVRAILGPGIRLYTDQLFVKPAHHGSEVPFHQDHAYWQDLEPYNMISCWLALDDATIENGCVRMIPGSNKALIPHREFNGPNSLGLLESDVETARETPVEIKAGSAMFHHSLTVHRSFPNQSDHNRRGLVTIYAPSKIYFNQPWPFRYGFREIVDGQLWPQS